MPKSAIEKIGIVVLVIAGGVGAYFGIKYLAGAAPQEPEEYVCPICGESFATYEELKVHFNTAHEGEPIDITWD